MSNDRLTIGQRINEVRKSTGYIKREKAGTGKGVEHDAVTAHIRDALIKYGVLTIVTELKGKLKDTGRKTSGGTPVTAWIAKYQITFCCDDDLEDNIPVEITGIGEDFGDKGPGKAISYATKTAELKLLNIESGESDESRIEEAAQLITAETYSKIETMRKEKKISNWDERMEKRYGTSKLSELSQSDGDELLRVVESAKDESVEDPA